MRRELLAFVNEELVEAMREQRAGELDARFDKALDAKLSGSMASLPDRLADADADRIANKVAAAITKRGLGSSKKNTPSKADLNHWIMFGAGVVAALILATIYFMLFDDSSDRVALAETRGMQQCQAALDAVDAELSATPNTDGTDGASDSLSEADIEQQRLIEQVRARYCRTIKGEG